MSKVTRILSAIEQGDPAAAGQLLPVCQLGQRAGRGVTWQDPLSWRR